MQITDGSGSGYGAKVDNHFRLYTDAVTQSTVEQAAQNGDSFNVNTGTISLTSDDERALIYLKNNGDEDIVIATIGYLLGNATGGSGDLLATVLRNPTAGTIVSGATAVDIIANKNFGSSATLEADAYKGSSSTTLTDGTVAYYSLLSAAGRSYAISTGDVVIPKGSSIGINFTPATGTTALNVQVFFSLIKKDA